MLKHSTAALMVTDLRWAASVQPHRRRIAALALALSQRQRNLTNSRAGCVRAGERGKTQTSRVTID